MGYGGKKNNPIIQIDNTELKGQINGLNAELAHITQQVGAVSVATPSDFSWKDHPLADRIWKDLNRGVYFTDYDVSVNQATGKTYYVNQSTGSDYGNDGLTPTTPFKTLLRAYNKSDVEVIVICGNKLYLENGFNGTVLNKSVTIKTLYGVKCLVSNYNYTTWTKTTGATNVYQSAKTDVGGVIDISRKDDVGEYLELTKVGSIPEVDSTVDSYYFDGTSTLYVNADNGALPKTNIYPIPARYTIEADLTGTGGNNKIYLENLEIIGGLKIVGQGYLYANKSKVTHCKAGSNVSIDVTKSILQDFISTKANMDGIAYSSSNGNIEINCVGMYNGDGSSEIQNGTTGHANSKIIRLNGSYHHNHGPNVADVQDATESWNIGCEAHHSLATDFQQCDFQAQDGATNMFLDGCKGYGSTHSIHIKSTANIFTRNGDFESWSIYATATGTITEY